MLFIVVGDEIHEDDLELSRILQSHKMPFLLLRTKTDEKLDAESRESRQEICNRLKQRHIDRGQKTS